MLFCNQNYFRMLTFAFGWRYKERSPVVLQFHKTSRSAIKTDMRMSWIPATLPLTDPPTLLACRELVTLHLSAYFLFHRCPNIRLRPLERWRKIIMFLGNVGNSVTLLMSQKNGAIATPPWKPQDLLRWKNVWKRTSPKLQVPGWQIPIKCMIHSYNADFLCPRVIKLPHAIVSEVISRKLLICNYWLLLRRI